MGPADQPDITASREEPSSCLVRNQLQRANEPYSPRLAHQRVVRQLAPALLEVGTRVRANTIHDPLLLQNSDISHRYGTGNRMTRVSEPMVELATLVNQHIRHPVTHHHARQRLIAGSDPLGHCHEVRFESESLITKPVPQAAKAANDLIGNEQDPVVIANALNFGPVAVRGNNHATRALNRLADKSSDLPGTELLNLLLQPPRGLQAIFFR